MIFSEWLDEKASKYTDRPAVDCGGERRTYSDFAVNSRDLAAGLVALGVEPGDRIAIMMQNSIAFIELWFATATAGLVEVPINPSNKGDLLRYTLDQCNARIVACDTDLVPQLVRVIGRLPSLEHLVLNAAAGTDVDLTGVPAHLNVHWLPDLYLGGQTLVLPKLSSSSPGTIIYTSGTTGPSKGAVLSHRAAHKLATTTVEMMRYGPDDHLYTAFPLFHANAKWTTVMAAMEAGGRATMHQRFSASTFWDTCRELDVTAFNYMGALLLMLWKQPEREVDAHHRVRAAFGAPCPVDIFEGFEKRFNLRLTEIYGMTEITMVSCDVGPNRRIGSAGKPLAHFDVRIVDNDDNVVGPNTPGEIVVRPNEPSVMMDGYHDMADATLKAYRNLWFHTGDRGRLDADGWLYFIDRTKDSIRRRGENISSYEIERVISDHPKVFDSAVYGVPSELTEEDVMVAVILQPGIDLSPVELLDYCQEHMPHFSVPRYVRFMTEFPRTPSQRIQKFELRGEGLTADTWDRDAHGYQVRR